MKKPMRRTGQDFPGRNVFREPPAGVRRQHGPGGYPLRAVGRTAKPVARTGTPPLSGDLLTQPLFQPEPPYLLPGMESRWPTGLRDRETGNRSGNAEKRIRLLTEQSVGRRFFYSESPVAKHRRNGLLAGRAVYTRPSPFRWLAKRAKESEVL